MAAEHLAEQIDFELQEVFLRPNQDTVYIGLDDLGHPRPAEPAQGGYIVPNDIAAHILNTHDQDNQPEEIIDATAILMEDEDPEWLRSKGLERLL
jgi:hypothetical protein